MLSLLLQVNIPRQAPCLPPSRRLCKTAPWLKPTRSAAHRSCDQRSRCWGLSSGGRAGRICRLQAFAEGVGSMSHVWAFDFDGVVCDSVGESSLSAIKAAVKLWPEIFDTPEAAAKQDELVEKMRTVRPVVETGYENLVQVRLLYEGMPEAKILQRWHEILPEYMQKWQLDRSELVHMFGDTRDEWMKEDLQGWLAPNRIYPGIADLLLELIASQEVYIVTTKQARFTEALLRDKAGIDFQADRIFSQTVSGQPKSEVLEQLHARHPGCSYHFVEDKFGTLDKVSRQAEIDPWQLYLVDWGYNTQQERDAAAANPRIQVVDLHALELAARPQAVAVS